MKKILSLLMILLLMSSAFSASATSLFPSIPTALTEEAPSYGALMDVDPLREETLDDGSLQQTYGGVSQENFDAYGVYLSEKGYTLPSHEYTDTSLIAAVKKDDIHFQVTFDWTAQTLVITYPLGIKYEQREVKNPFEGYVPVSMGQTVTFKGFVEMTFDSFESTTCPNPYRNCPYSLNATIKNISTSETDNQFLFYREHFVGHDKIPQILATMFYINTENTYSWECKHSYFPEFFYPVLESGIILACFDIPAEVINADDGILALTLDSRLGEEKFVLYLRGDEE